jgi:phenylalanyl-tRNA synthetase beta chain
MLTLRQARVGRIIGVDVGSDEIVRVLSGLGCDVRSEGDTFDVAVPSWRPDLEREIDLIEELARHHGYQTIPAVLAPGVRGGRSDTQILRERVRDALLGAGLAEATLSSFCAQEDIDAIGYDGPLVLVSNPMTEDQRQLRPSLFPGLLRAAQRNIAHGMSTVRLFEFGKIFRGWPEGAGLPDESEHVAFVLVGDQNAHWSGDERPADVYDAIGLVDLALEELGDGQRALSTDGLAPLFHPGRSANVLRDGVMIGRLGELRPSVARAFDLEPPVVVGGLALDALWSEAPTTMTVQPLPTQPPVLRHISMWLPQAAAVSDIAGAMQDASGELLERVDVLDEYVADGRRSVAFALTFRAADRTLRAEEADAARSAIVEAVSALGAEIR